MRPHRLLLVATVVALVALLVAPRRLPAQQAPPGSEGLLLLESLPRTTDLVVQTPSLPALRNALLEAGVGDAKSWNDAFGAQLRDWGAFSGEPQKLEAAGRALLAAADGEALVAALPIEIAGESDRATLVAFRTTWDDKRLASQVRVLVSHGFRDRYLAEPREQEIVGRRVLALSGVDSELWIHAADGLVVAADHPLAMALLFRGLRRAAEKDLPDEAGLSRLAVRFGAGESAWNGFVLGAREGVSWQAGPDEQTRTAPLGPSDAPLVALALRDVSAAPLLPAPLPDWMIDLAGSVRGLVGEEPLSVAQRPDGAYQVAARYAGDQAAADAALGASLPEGVVVRAGDGRLWLGPVDAEAGAFPEVAGATTRSAWLRALAAGRFALPPGVDRRLLLGPLTATDGDRTRVEWKPGSRAGELRGPAYDGPATFLALRTLAHLSSGVAPNLPPPPPRPTTTPSPVPDDRGAPLPPPKKEEEGR